MKSTILNRSHFLNRKLLKSGHKIDHSLLWMVILMTAFSLIMIYSASVAYAGAEGNKWMFLWKQSGFVAMGGLLALWGARRPMTWWRHKTPYILIISFLLLIAVLFLGREINGAKRWLNLGLFNVQPSEIFKLVLILYLADFFNRRAEVLSSLKKMVPPGIMIGFGLFLIYREPDFGSIVICMMIWMGMLYLAGLPWRWFATVVAIVAAFLCFAVVLEPYRLARLTTYIDPWQDPMGKGYQLTHSLMAIARGDWFGVGIGSSLEKRFYLPEAHTDFIFAVINEEFGFVGMCLLIFCYVWLVWRAFSIGKQAKELDLLFGAFVAKGIGIWLGIQSFFNISVNTGLLPTKGLTLPLMSYGGSAVVVMLVCMALLLRVDYENRLKMRGFKVEG